MAEAEGLQKKKPGTMMASRKWMNMDENGGNGSNLQNFKFACELFNAAILCTFEVLQVATHVVLSKNSFSKKYSHIKN